MADFLQGFLAQQQAGIEAINDITVAIRNWYANRNPLYTRLRHIPVDRVDFLMYTHKYRARGLNLTGNIASNSTTTLTVDNASSLAMHDVIQITDGAGNYERVQLSADPTVSNATTGAGTIAVVRGVSGTTKLSSATASAGSPLPIVVIGNSRTGSEINQTGRVTVGAARTQYCQTFQNPVQVGGSAQTTRAAVMPGGVQSPFDFNKTMELQNLVDDIEVTMYVGVAEAPADATTVTAKMNGLNSILTTNNVTSPTNAGAYKPTDLIRDTLQAARTGGGEPDLLIVGSEWMSGFATWGHAVQRIPAGETEFGIEMNLFHAPFLGGVDIIEAPLMTASFGSISAIALTSSEIYIRPKRNPFWNPRGNRGDMIEGDWIAELAIEVVNETHHAVVSGITAFSAS